MSLPRRLEAEWLDHLPADDPRAMRSRRDLTRVNSFMGNAGRMADALLRHTAGETPRTMVDLGSGDGQFMLQVARRLAPRWRGVSVRPGTIFVSASVGMRSGFARPQEASVLGSARRRMSRHGPTSSR